MIRVVGHGVRRGEANQPGRGDDGIRRTLDLRVISFMG